LRAELQSNGTTVIGRAACSGLTGAFPEQAVTVLANLTASWTVGLYAYQDSGGNLFSLAGALGASSWLSVVEVPQW
jgi:hypothetical protein